MAMRFDLIGAGVLAPGIGSIDQLIEIATMGRPPPSVAATATTDDRSSRWGASSVQPPAPFAAPPSPALPANERRRASAVVRLVLACAQQALARRPERADSVRLVFAADEGVGDVCQAMLEALAHYRPLSPLVFANSVHNAPSGYFSIAHGNQRPATSLSLGEQSFACGLLSAVAEAQSTRQPVLFLNYDTPMPMPLRSLLPIGQPSASAWLIVASGANAGGGAADRPLATFTAELVEARRSDGCDPLEAAPPRASLDHRPAWLQGCLAANSSALGIAALGLLATTNAVRHYSLGRQVLRLSRVACSAL